MIVMGVKNRCRKVARHLVKLGRGPVEFDAHSLREKARAWIRINMKSWSRAMVHADFTLDENDMETWQVFDPRHWKEELQPTDSIPYFRESGPGVTKHV